MNLVDVISKLMWIWENIQENEDEKILKSYKNEAKELTKNLRKIKRVDVDDALYMLRNIANLDTYNMYEEYNWLWVVVRETYTVRQKFSEAFMDANAVLVREQLGFSHPEANEILRFKVELVGFSSHEWSFFPEFSRKVIDMRLPMLTFEGIAKMDPNLFYLDWIGGKTQESVPYYFGPTTVSMKPSIFPLVIISSLRIPSDDPKYDFGFTIASSTKMSKGQLRTWRKENPYSDYNPLPDFDFRVKIEKTKGESDGDRQEMRNAIENLLKKNVKESPTDIGWTMAFIRSFGFGFSPLMRGSIIQRGSNPPIPEISNNYLPIKSREYLLTVRDKFDEDSVDFGEGHVNDFPILYGSTGISSSYTIYAGIPLPTPSNQIITSHCLSVIGCIDSVSVEQIKSFSENSVSFVRNELHVKNRNVVIIPVLLANTITAEAKEWVEHTIKMPGLSGWGLIVPTLMDLTNGKLYYCKTGKAVPNLNIYMFISRYLETNEMRWSKVKIPSVASTSATGGYTTCPHCGAQYRLDDDVTEVTCQNCLKTYLIESE